MKPIEGTISYQHQIPLQRLQDLLICALEGGSNYWYTNADYDFPAEHAEDINKASGGVFSGYWAPFYDGCLTLQVKFDDELPRWNGQAFESVTGGNGMEWVIKKADLERGLETMAKKYPRHMNDLISEDEDADTGDVFLQCVCFGDLVYG